MAEMTLIGEAPNLGRFASADGKVFDRQGALDAVREYQKACARVDKALVGYRWWQKPDGVWAWERA